MFMNEFFAQSCCSYYYLFIVQHDSAHYILLDEKSANIYDNKDQNVIRPIDEKKNYTSTIEDVFKNFRGGILVLN